MTTRKNKEKPSIEIEGSVTQGPGSVIGQDNSSGKKVSTAMNPDLSNPVSLVIAAAKRIKAIWWAIGVAAIIALVAISSKWGVPPLGMVLGGLGLFIGMVALYAFASLLNPPPASKKPPRSSLILLWAFLVIFIAAGFFGFTSFFFDWPIPLRSMLIGSK